MSLNSAGIAEILPEDTSGIEDRRLRVQALRLRRLSAKVIAQLLNEPEQTVAADLEWIRTRHVGLFGPVPEVDAAQEIGWALADFEEMESVAWLEFHSLKQEAKERKLSPMYVARARQGWIRTAAMMRVLRLKLLAEHGLMQPATSSHASSSGSVGRADDIRTLLRSEGLLLDAAPDLAKAVLLDASPEKLDPFEQAVDPIASWMDDGGFFDEC